MEIELSPVDYGPLELEPTSLTEPCASTLERYRGTGFLNPERVRDVLCSELHVGYDDLVSKARHQPLACTRQLMQYIVREVTGASYPTLGRCFRRDHTTVMHAVKKVARMVTSDARSRGVVGHLISVVVSKS